MENFISTAHWVNEFYPMLSKKAKRNLVIEYLTSPKLDPEKFKLYNNEK